MMLRRFGFLLLATTTALVTACGRAPSPQPRPATVTVTATTAPTEAGRPAPPMVWPLEIVDSLGRKVTLAKPASRVISLAPSNSELLFAVGAGDRVIGRSSVDDYPAEVTSRPSIGGMTPKGMNLEAILALKPDLVLATSGVQEPVIAPIERLGLTVVALDAQDFAGVARNLRLVGQLTDHADEAERVATRFLDRVEAVRRRVATRQTPRPRVLYLVREEPLMTAGPSTFIGQLIETAGGTNVFGDVSTRFPRPSEEEIIARSPEVIVTAFGAMNTGKRDDEARRAHLRSRPGWAQIPAIRDGRITILDEAPVTRPGPRLVEGLEAMAEALEPAPPRPAATPGPG